MDAEYSTRKSLERPRLDLVAPRPPNVVMEKQSEWCRRLRTTTNHRNLAYGRSL